MTERKLNSSKFRSVTDIVSAMESNKTICTVGMTLISASETVLTEIERRFLAEGKPNNMTLIHAAGQGDRKRGILHLAHEGLVTKLIGAHWGLQPEWMRLIAENKVVCYCLPQGQITHLYRAMSSGGAGVFTKVGLGSFVDPRVEGGKMNELTRSKEDLTSITEILGEEYLFIPAIPIDYCLIRGTEADEEGNLTTSEEAMKLEVLPAVLATKRYGGKVIAQVKRKVKTGSLNPKDVVVPSVFIDDIVVCDKPYEDHRQTSSWYYDPCYSGQAKAPENKLEVLELDERTVIGRRAVQELKTGDIINLGTGIPNDVIGKILKNQALDKEVAITVESGIYNGIQAGGIDFGIAKNMTAMITHHEQMDFYNGKGVDVAFLGAGELDEKGNVNSTKMGNICPGAGGFLDIIAGAKKIVFCSTFKAKGLKINCRDGRLDIVQEGSICKFVKKVKQISLSGQIALEKGQEVLFVTERAVFSVKQDGVHLCEIAEGLSLNEDVLKHMDFMPLIDEPLKIMDNSLFQTSSEEINKN